MNDALMAYIILKGFEDEDYFIREDDEEWWECWFAVHSN